MAWLCSCGLVNYGLNKRCVGIGQPIIKHSEHNALLHFYSRLEYDIDKYQLQLLARSYDGKLTMTEAEDLFAKWYSHEKVLVADMDSPTLRAHEEELAKIAHEAKARLTAISDTKRERNAKLRSDQKEWLVPISAAEDTLVSDAINAVAKRGARKNKVEKFMEQAAALGLDPKLVASLGSNIEKRATENQINLMKLVNANVEQAKLEEAQESKEKETKQDPTDTSWLANIKYGN